MTGLASQLPRQGGTTTAPAAAALEDFDLTGRKLAGLLAAFLFYLPNQAQLGSSIGVRGLNIANIIFLIILIALFRRKAPSAGPAPMKGALMFFFGVLSWALVVGMASDSTTWVDDITVFKNCVFYVLLYFLFFHAVRDLKTIRLLFLTILFVTFTSAVLGFRQALDYGIGAFNETRRVAAPFGWGYFAANRSAIFFCISFPILLSAGLMLKSHKWLRLASLFTAALVVFVVFHTYSRQAYAILAVVALLLTLRRNLLLAGVIVAALLSYEVWVPESVVERIQMTKAEPEVKPTSPGEEEQQYDVSTESRFTLWEGAGELILSRPWGIGFNHFKREIGAHVPAYLAGKDAHNFFVLITTEAGVVAPFAMIALLAGFAMLAWRALRQDDSEESRVLGTSLMMTIPVVILGNVYGSRFLDGEVMVNFWVLAALCAKYAVLKEGARRQDAKRAVPAAAVNQWPARASSS